MMNVLKLNARVWIVLISICSLPFFAAAEGVSEVKASLNQEALKCDLKFKKLHACGTLSWVIPPKRVEMITEKDQAELTLLICPQKSFGKGKFRKKNRLKHEHDLKKEFDRVHVRLWMPSMGHGSRPTQVRELVGEGACLKFHVDQLYFSMPGDWEIQVELKKNQKILDQAKYPYDL